MIIGIDASNIRSGGGITHLAEVLAAVEPESQGVEKIIIWAGKATIAQLPVLPHIEYRHRKELDGNLVRRFWWQMRHLAREAQGLCDVLFIPGGTYLGRFRPYVAMAQNSLPFSRVEMARFRVSARRIKWELLRQSQLFTFRRAASTIFPSHFIRDQVAAVSARAARHPVVIPHGLNARFDHPPRPQRSLDSFTEEEPFRLLYVSIITAYKHQWRVVEAVSKLRASGIAVQLDLVGPPVTPFIDQLRATIERVDPRSEFVFYHGEQPFSTLHETYRRADGFVFASTCESFGQIVLEAMSAGLPIACSSKGAMPEVLGDGGIYFDPEDPALMLDTLREFVSNAELRERLAVTAYQRSKRYSWKECARQTIGSLIEASREGGAHLAHED